MGRSEGRGRRAIAWALFHGCWGAGGVGGIAIEGGEWGGFVVWVGLSAWCCPDHEAGVPLRSCKLGGFGRWVRVERCLLEMVVTYQRRFKV